MTPLFPETLCPQQILAISLAEFYEMRVRVRVSASLSLSLSHLYLSIYPYLLICMSMKCAGRTTTQKLQNLEMTR